MKQNKTRVALALLATLGAMALLAPMTQATPAGSLDPSFGTGGIVTTAIGPNATADSIVRLPDGKLVVAGTAGTPAGNPYAAPTQRDFVLVRYNPDGSLDTSFGTGGIVTTDFGGDDVATAMLRLPDGKLVVAGTVGANGAVALARYNPDGSLDTTFGTDGKTTTYFGGRDNYVAAMARQPDGKLVIAGRFRTGHATSVFAVSRFNPDGSLDTAFGAGGLVQTDFAFGQIDEALAVALQADGRILALGWTGNRACSYGPADACKSEIALARYNPDGSLDTSFGIGGKVSTAIGVTAMGDALILEHGGRIVAGGDAGTTGNQLNFTLARYKRDGSLDSSFGNAGIVTTDFGGNDMTFALAQQTDGRIIAAGLGSGTLGSSERFALARYRRDVSLDTTFGTGGKVTTAIGSTAAALAVTLTPGGDIVAAGITGPWPHRKFALARYESGHRRLHHRDERHDHGSRNE